MLIFWCSYFYLLRNFKLDCCDKERKHKLPELHLTRISALFLQACHSHMEKAGWSQSFPMHLNLRCVAVRWMAFFGTLLCSCEFVQSSE